MAWIYLAESEDSQKPWKATCGRSPTVKTIATLSVSFCHACRRDHSHLLPSGTTSQHSTHKSSVLALTSCMAVSPARTSRLLAAEKAWEESEAAYLRRSFAWLARYDRDSSSWKMCQLSVFG